MNMMEVDELVGLVSDFDVADDVSHMQQHWLKRWSSSTKLEKLEPSVLALQMVDLQPLLG